MLDIFIKSPFKFSIHGSRVNYFFVGPLYSGPMASLCGFPYMVKYGITQKSLLIGM